MQNTMLQRKKRIIVRGRRIARNYAGTLVFLVVFISFFALFAVPMGLANTLNTLMNTAYSLLMNTTLYIMAIAVIAGAISSLFSAFGVIRLLNKLLSPLMKPLYGLPGAAALSMVTTYFSDNPAILTLASDTRYRTYFKGYQIPVLANLGTSFGMGMIVSTFMLGLSLKSGESTASAVICGNIGALLGSIVGTRLMMHHTAAQLGRDAGCEIIGGTTAANPAAVQPSSSGWLKVMDALISGGKNGVTLGLGIIPGVLIICTMVMMLTNGMPAGGYTGGANEGIALLPYLAEKASFILEPLFGFSDGSAIAVPVTALGSAGAAIGTVPALIDQGVIFGNDIAVFTAMCMGWSGFLSTQVSIMDVLGCRRFTGRALLNQTISGLSAGIAAHWLYTLVSLL